MSTFVPAAGLHACYLNDQTPTGLMRFDDGEGEWLFWIIREDDKTMAVQLTEQGGRRWQARVLDDDGEWLGLHLGSVEVEIDPATVELHDSNRGELGRIFVRSGSLHFRAQGGRYNDRWSLQISDASGAAESTTCAAFPHWRLIQRRGRDEVAVLFTAPPA